MNKLTEREKKMYILRCKYYMAQFLPKAVKEKTKMTIELDGEYTLAAYSTVVLKKGYTAIFKDIKPKKLRNLALLRTVCIQGLRLTRGLRKRNKAAVTIHKGDLE